MNQLKTYQRRLTNLSGKNRSLLLLKLAKSRFIDLHKLDFAQNEPSFRIIERMIAKRVKTKLCAVVDSRDKAGNEASKNLRDIFRTDRLITEERGAKDLYVGYPFVRGKMLDDSLIAAPLLYFPVSLSVENGFWMLHLRQDVPVSFNKTLLLAFSHFNHLQFTEDFIEQSFEDFSKELRPFLTELYKYLEESPLEINFNQANFEEKLQDFQEFTKVNFQKETRTGELKAYPEAVLGIFPQADSYLSPDYDTLIENNALNDVEKLFLPSQSILENDPDLQVLISMKAAKEENLTTPYDLDATQEMAIKSLKTGRSIVVQGPPGSGKSQLICNLVADSISRGKKVLVVCQKKAALDVVYKRLDEKTFADFTALVHDFRNDRRAVYEKINRNIELIPDFQTENNSLDTIYLERSFLQNSREIDQIIEELEEFRMALYNTSECGVSAKELYLTSNPHLPKIKLRREYEYFPEADAPEFIKKLKTFALYAKDLKRPTHPWIERVQFKDFSGVELPDIEKAVREVKPYAEEMATGVEKLIAVRVSLGECVWLLDREAQFKEMLELIEDETVFRYFKNLLNYPNADKLWLGTRKQNVMSAFGEEGVEKTLAPQQLGKAVEAVDDAIRAQKSWHERTKWNIFNKDKDFVNQIINDNQLQFEENPLPMLVRKIENRMNFEHQVSSLKEKEWLIEQPLDFEKESYKTWFELHLQAVKAKDIYMSLRNGIKYLQLEEFEFETLKSKIEELFEVVRNVPSKLKEWKKYLSIKQINELQAGETTSERLLESLDTDYEKMCEFDQFLTTIETHELQVIGKLHLETGYWEVETLVPLFENSLRVAWLNHIEAKHPILKSVSTPKLQMLEDNLQEALKAKKKVCQQIALMNVRERTYKEVEFNRLNNRVTYRDLQHQVNKKRSVWSLRKVIDNFSNELFNIMPCWLASPETVSAIFPMEQLFDLVIFDEASQCFVEKGIPAMYRGKQVAIVGDSQQLAPYDLYHPRWEQNYDNEEEEEDPSLEVDSLLDLGCRYLEQITLTGHYRSEALELIDFSNRHFYNGKLRMLPNSERFVHAEPAIDYLKVAGVWEKNSNQIEAEKVVELLKDYLAKDLKNIGVITFNFKQQELIQDLLEEQEVNIPSDIFIKNIENVQGDERDIIIFSIGYAPTPSGQMRVQFGGLNLEKGENRLNVAITRARKKIVVVSSILPSQLQVEETKNLGPKLLKEYLQYAHEVSEGNFQPNPTKPKTFAIDWYLKEKMRKLSDGKAKLRSDLPFADLAIAEPERTTTFQTDDDLFYQANSMKEYFGYTPFLLKNKGWEYKRFHSRTFWKNYAEFEEEFWKWV